MKTCKIQNNIEQTVNWEASALAEGGGSQNPVYRGLASETPSVFWWASYVSRKGGWVSQIWATYPPPHHRPHNNFPQFGSCLVKCFRSD